MSELLRLDAAEMARRLHAGEVSAVELTRAHLERIAEVDGDGSATTSGLHAFLHVDAEGALRRTIDKFTKRFAHVEARVKQDHGGWGTGEGNLPLEVLDRYWEEAKTRSGAD